MSFMGIGCFLQAFVKHCGSSYMVLLVLKRGPFCPETWSVLSWSLGRFVPKRGLFVLRRGPFYPETWSILSGPFCPWPVLSEYPTSNPTLPEFIYTDTEKIVVHYLPWKQNGGSRGKVNNLFEKLKKNFILFLFRYSWLCLWERMLTTDNYVIVEDIVEKEFCIEERGKGKC